MSDEVAPVLPRWIVTFSPTPDGKEADVNFQVHAPDVYAWQIVFTMSRLLTQLAAQPGTRLATVEEEKARAVEAALVQSHPAKKLLVRAGKQLWLGDAALAEHAESLKSRGWMDAGPVPEGVQRACDAVRDPEAFGALLAEGVPMANPRREKKKPDQDEKKKPEQG